MRAARLMLPVVAACVIATGALVAQTTQEKVDHEVYARIRAEALERSQILQTLHMLTDVYGPRLTGSPNLKAASDWVVKRTTEWGLTNARLEPWDFGRPGWANERTSAFLTAPVKDSLVVETLAWTPGTKGPVTASAVLIEPPARVTREQLTAYFDANRARVNGRVVLVGAPARVPVTINPPAKRRDDAQVTGQFSSDAPRPGGPGGPPQGPQGPPAAPAKNLVPANVVNEEFGQFLVAAGAVARINDAGREHGQIRAFSNSTYDVTKVVPTLVMRNEDYGRIARLLDSNMDVQLEIDIVNQVYPEGKTQYNVIAEIAGTDKAHEVVMLGGHLDSWHSATGATDNAIGCTVMMEAIRILQAVGAKPRRTVRLALWSGEEQGLLGSQAYVREHFGSFEKPKPEYANFAGYFNIDSGTGRARGMTVFGPPQAAAILRQALVPFGPQGVAGATSTTSRRRGGSDHTSFNEAGLPGIGVAQDPIEYGSHTWHTNLDTYERVIESDAQASAMGIASAVYHLAMRDEKLPRLTKEQMPRLPGTTTSQ
ncbi:MAG TPA: M20/M25/M40 family metallo-hydrolase [Vicinamibacterales bacterium]|nr:M20/M25/M40 family metallo-hydrolase [Vicinamibacterales bacterium]